MTSIEQSAAAMARYVAELEGRVAELETARDVLLADQRRLLYLASTAICNWGRGDRAGYELGSLHFESARGAIRPDDFRKAIDAAMAGPCPTCHGSGLVTIRGMCGGVEMDCDDQPCPECAEGGR
jgi:hypothetical protein